MCLAFLVDEGPKMKLGSCCGQSKMQFTHLTLRSLADFYIELSTKCEVGHNYAQLTHNYFDNGELQESVIAQMIAKNRNPAGKILGNSNLLFRL